MRCLLDFFIAYIVKADGPLISDLSRRRLKYQSCKNLQRRPTSAEYELHKNLRVGWDYQLHKPPLTNGCKALAHEFSHAVLRGNLVLQYGVHIKACPNHVS